MKIWRITVIIVIGSLLSTGLIKLDFNNNSTEDMVFQDISEELIDTPSAYGIDLQAYDKSNNIGLPNGVTITCPPRTSPITIENNTFIMDDDTISTLSYAIRVQDCQDVVIRNNTIMIIAQPDNENVFLKSITGIEIKNSNNVSIFNNTIKTISTVGGALSTPSRCDSNQRCDAIGIYAENSQQLNITDNNITRLIAPSGSEGIGIKIVSSTNSHV
ncbi:MAG: hypothetical protein ACXAD7_19225, partial [Candidatus Kariarchaeaceae archaeon]